ncbi:MAG: glycoside hydrolase family 99-like domain-containing protein [Xanthomonadales bacterium]|nr:glycoside hydrolase family 99-like domain-containing protein [Xanthomonadales bacterium]
MKAANLTMGTFNKVINLIAFYLPQFHPISENDEWWGKGFTEWTNVARSVPLFSGHNQPQLPADLGYYDLRVPEVREEQAKLARSFGITGFCYYHYWFQGHRLLNRPFDEVISSGNPDFPFCLCWANETWSRRWLGEERSILLQQTYSDQDDVEHARSLMPAFADHRQLRVDGRPVFLIYRPLDLPNPRKTCATLRDVSLKHGLPDPFLIGVNAHCRGTDARSLGFDHTLDFRPQLGALPAALDESSTLARLMRNMKKGIPKPWLKVYEYEEAVACMDDFVSMVPTIPSVFVDWDNTPRRGERGIVIRNGSPEKFERILQSAIENSPRVGSSERFVFINAWNEWAEGNHLEPDLVNGHGYLQAVANALAHSDSRTKTT